MSYAGTNNLKRTRFPDTTIGDLTKAARDILPSRGNLFCISVINPNTAPIFLKFYNTKAAAVSVSTSIPWFEFVVQGAASTPGMIIIRAGVEDRGFYFDGAISVRCCTGFADNDDTDASTPPHVIIETSQPTT